MSTKPPPPATVLVAPINRHKLAVTPKSADFLMAPKQLYKTNTVLRLCSSKMKIGRFKGFYLLHMCHNI